MASRKCRLIFISVLSLMLASCAGPRKSADSSIPPPTHDTGEVAGPPVPYGPLPPTPVEEYGPEPVMVRPIILVLGPGWARGFAHVGVLKALKEANVPIGGIISTEMGALVGAAFSTARTINEFEWSMLRLKSELFSGRSEIFRGLLGQSSSGKGLSDELEDLFGAKELTDTKIPMRVLIQGSSGGAPKVIGEGSIVKLLRAAIAIPGWMEPGDWNGMKMMSAGKSRPFPVSEAKLLGEGRIVVIDVLDHSGSPKFGSKVPASVVDYFKRAEAAGVSQDADLVIRPDLSGIGYAQFDKRTEIVFRGKKAVMAELSRIKHLVGSP